MMELARSMAAGALWTLAFVVLLRYAARRVGGGMSAALMAAYPAFFALQMVLAKLLGVLGFLTSTGFLTVYAIAAGLGVGWYVRQRRTAAVGPDADQPTLDSDHSGASDPDALLTRQLTLGGAALVIAGLGVFSLISPVYVWDSLAYHMTMVASYIQNGSLEPWPTQDLRQVVRVNGGELQLLNLALLSGSDAWVELPNLLGLAVCLAAAYQLARLVVPHPTLPYLVVALVLTAPQIQVGAATAKNDLMFTAVLLCAFYWVTRAASSDDGRAATYAGLAAFCGALATATKVLGLNVLGAVGLLILLLVLTRRIPARVLVAFCLTALVALVVLVGDVYWYNFTRSAVPVGIAPREVFFRTGLLNLTEAAKYYVYDLSFKRLVIPQVFEHDFSHYGYLWPFLFAGGAAAAIRQAARRRARRLPVAALALMAAALFASVIAVRTPISWDQRFMIWMVPVFAILAVSLLERISGRHVVVLTTASISLALVNVMLTLSNETGGLFVRSAARLAVTGDAPRYIELPIPRDARMAAGFAVLDDAPATTSVLYVGSDDSWMYPSWGRRFTRRVRGVWNASDAAEQVAARRHEFLVIESDAAPAIRAAAMDAARASGYEMVAAVEKRSILRRPPASALRPPEARDGRPSSAESKPVADPRP